MQLLVLGSLRYLGRGWTFNHIEEATGIHKEVHCVFLHCFIAFGSTVFYEKHVLSPVSIADAHSHMSEFSEARFPGCIGLTNCMHITTEKCEYYLKGNHLGGKSSQTTRTFNLTCNHRRRILHSTPGGPGRWNNTMMVCLDKFISGIRDVILLNDLEFELLSYDKEGDVILLKY